MSRPKGLKPGQSQSEIDFLARPAKELILPANRSGDCHQITGMLLFYPAGTGVWTCCTMNRHAHHSAVWHTDFTLRDSHGAALFGVGPFFGPRMLPGPAAGTHVWHREFEFPSAYFTEITTATQNSGCRLEIFYGSRESGKLKGVKKPLTKTSWPGTAADLSWAASLKALAFL